MSATRPVRLTDLVGLIFFDGGPRRNQAWPWERLGQATNGPHPLESALEQWFSFATGRRTWVDVRGQTVKGLASIRRRAGGSVWEVESLIAADEGACLRLLDRLSESAAHAGVERVFLRLAVDSPFLPAARQAGFAAYMTEHLWQGTAAAGPSPPDDVRLRQCTAADNFSLFRLYSAVVPAVVRQAEAPTMREWLGSLEMRRSGRPCDLVLEREGVIAGWASIGRKEHLTRLAVLLHPSERDCVDELLGAILARVERGRPVLCLVPTYAVDLASALADRGFLCQEEYIALVRRLARPVAVETAPQSAQQGYTLPTLLSKP